MGYINRDFNGRFLLTGTSNLGETSIIIAEAIAMRDGVQNEIQFGYKNLILEDDNKILK